MFLSSVLFRVFSCVSWATKLARLPTSRLCVFALNSTGGQLSPLVSSVTAHGRQTNIYPMKHVAIGNLLFSKILCGTNAFWGHSHFSKARDTEYLGRFDEAMIERTAQQCLDLGVNAIESCANERIVSILERLRQKTPDPLRYVGSTRIDETSEMKTHQEKLAFLIKHRADVCVIHSQFVDRPRKGGSIVGLRELVDQIHGAGLLAGISTHQVKTVELCEQENYGVDIYMFPLNMSGFVYPGFKGQDTVHDRVNIVRGVAKPFILMKTLAAGRIPPGEGLHFIAENSKPDDLISIGFGGIDEVKETIQIAEQYLR